MSVLTCCRRLSAVAIALALSPALVSGSPKESDSWSVWWGSQLALSWPTGGFQPPSSERGLGYALCASFVPPRKPVGLRLEFGTVEHRSHLDNISVDNPNGLWVDNLQNVETGSRLSWGMIGAQWDLRSHDSGIYCYAMGGIERVSPTEVLGDGYPLIEADVPGLPRSSNGFAWSAGIGSRLRVPGRKNFAITGELDYRRLGQANYVTAPGVEGDYPNSRYVVTSGPVETFTARIGLAINHSPR